MTQITDGRGKVFAVGQKVARAVKFGMVDGVYVKECTVTRIDDGKLYLDDSKQAIKFPDRILILGD